MVGLWVLVPTIGVRIPVPERKQERKYVLCFTNNYLLRDIIEMLDKNGFLPLPLHK